MYATTVDACVAADCAQRHLVNVSDALWYAHLTAFWHSAVARGTTNELVVMTIKAFIHQRAYIIQQEAASSRFSLAVPTVFNTDSESFL